MNIRCIETFMILRMNFILDTFFFTLLQKNTRIDEANIKIFNTQFVDELKLFDYKQGMLILKRLIVFACQCFVFDTFCKVGCFFVVVRIGSSLSGSGCTC